MEFKIFSLTLSLFRICNNNNNNNNLSIDAAGTGLIRQPPPLQVPRNKITGSAPS